MRHRSSVSGVKFGSTKLVKAILEPHRLGLDKKANARLDQLLTRQDIEAWLNRGVEFSTGKFHFVDFYVQSLLKSDEGRELRALIESSFSQEMCRILAELYRQTRHYIDEEYFNANLKGRIYELGRSLRDNGGFNLLLLNGFHHGVMFAKILILDAAPGNIGDLSERQDYREAYFVLAPGPSINAAMNVLSGVVFVRNPELHNRMSRSAKQDGLSMLVFTMSSNREIDFTYPAEYLPFGLRMSFMPRSTQESTVCFRQSSNSEFSQLFEKLSGRVV